MRTRAPCHASFVVLLLAVSNANGDLVGAWLDDGDMYPFDTGADFAANTGGGVFVGTRTAVGNGTNTSLASMQPEPPSPTLTMGMCGLGVLT